MSRPLRPIMKIFQNQFHCFNRLPAYNSLLFTVSFLLLVTLFYCFLVQTSFFRLNPILFVSSFYPLLRPISKNRPLSLIELTPTTLLSMILINVASSPILRQPILPLCRYSADRYSRSFSLSSLSTLTNVGSTARAVPHACLMMPTSLA